MIFKLKATGLAALAAAFVLGTGVVGMGASAATLSLKGGTDFILGSSGAFDPQPGGAAYNAFDPDAVMRNGSVVKQISGTAKRNDTSLGLSIDAASKVTFTYLGREADYLNAFLSVDAGHASAGGFNTATSGIGDSFTIDAGAGLLEFGFVTLKGAGLRTGSYFSNAGKATRSRDIGLAYSAIFNAGKSIILGFNDIASVDADYDDLVVRVDVAPVPLPAAGLLLLGGLGALGAASRRRAAAAA